MAQAKTRASAKRSRGSQKSQTRARGSTSKASKSRTSSKKARTSRKAASAPRAQQQSGSSSNGKGRLESARHAVEDKAKDAGHVAKDAGQAVGGAASKAKIPLVASGAALAGAAGGVALGMHQARRHRGIGRAIPHRPKVKVGPKVKVNSRDLTKVAKEVGTFGAQMGHLASELQHSREAANGAKRRSPVEVLLEGLTSRRSTV